MMRPLTIVGLAWAAFLAGVSAGAAQSGTDTTPPIKLPGVVYPTPEAPSTPAPSETPAASEPSQGAQLLRAAR